MASYLFKNNEQYGPFEESAVRGWLESGQLSSSDLGFREGATDWQLLGDLIPTGPMPPTPQEIQHLSSRIENELLLLQNYEREIDLACDDLDAGDDRSARRLQ